MCHYATVSFRNHTHVSFYIPHQILFQYDYCNSMAVGITIRVVTLSNFYTVELPQLEYLITRMALQRFVYRLSMPNLHSVLNTWHLSTVQEDNAVAVLANVLQCDLSTGTYMFTHSFDMFISWHFNYQPGQGSAGL